MQSGHTKMQISLDKKQLEIIISALNNYYWDVHKDSAEFPGNDFYFCINDISTLSGYLLAHLEKKDAD